MITEKTALDLIKEEFCNRYNLQPEQIRVSIHFSDIPQDQAEQMAKDYGNKWGRYASSFKTDACMSINNNLYDMFVHFPPVDEDE